MIAAIDMSTLSTVHISEVKVHAVRTYRWPILSALHSISYTVATSMHNSCLHNR
jgi:hypothetical protein